MFCRSCCFLELFPPSPYTACTLSRQIAPTVKPSPLHGVREIENQSSKRVCVLFLSFSLFFPPFSGPLIFLEILMPSSPSRVTDIKTASLWVCTHGNTQPVCVLQYDKQKYNTKKACVFPAGWNSWRVVRISIKIIQSVMLWLSFCGRVTVSFPSINLALCCFIALLPAEFLNNENPFHGSLENDLFLKFSHAKMTLKKYMSTPNVYIHLIKFTEVTFILKFPLTQIEMRLCNPQNCQHRL